MLPKQLPSCFAGSFTIDMTAGEPEIRNRTLEMLREVNAEREDRLVERMAALHASGSNAVTGLDDVLQAVSDKRVETLIISDGYRMPGYTDPASGFVVANLARSPLNHNELREVADVVDAAVALTVAQGGHVEVISEHPTLEDAGRIGAILRY
jgi:peptide subunit release factor 1 (eRF1)